METEARKDREKESAAAEKTAQVPQLLEDEAVGAVSGGMPRETLWYKKQKMGEKIGEDPQYKN